jgi:hypothetical protein
MPDCDVVTVGSGPPAALLTMRRYRVGLGTELLLAKMLTVIWVLPLAFRAFTAVHPMISWLSTVDGGRIVRRDHCHALA